MAYIYSMVCLFNYAILINLFLSQATFQKIKTETAPHINGTENVQRPSLPIVHVVDIRNYFRRTEDGVRRLVDGFESVLKNSGSPEEGEPGTHEAKGYLPKAVKMVVEMRESADTMLRRIDENGLETPSLQDGKHDCHQLKSFTDKVREIAPDNYCDPSVRAQAIVYFKSDMNCLLGSIFELWRATRRDGPYYGLSTCDVIQLVKNTLIEVEKDAKLFLEEVEQINIFRVCNKNNVLPPRHETTKLIATVKAIHPKVKPHSQAQLPKEGKHEDNLNSLKRQTEIEKLIKHEELEVQTEETKVEGDSHIQIDQKGEPSKETAAVTAHVTQKSKLLPEVTTSKAEDAETVDTGGVPDEPLEKEIKAGLDSWHSKPIVSAKSESTNITVPNDTVIVAGPVSGNETDLTDLIKTETDLIEKEKVKLYHILNEIIQVETEVKAFNSLKKNESKEATNVSRILIPLETDVVLNITSEIHSPKSVIEVENDEASLEKLKTLHKKDTVLPTVIASHTKASPYDIKIFAGKIMEKLNVSQKDQNEKSDNREEEEDDEEDKEEEDDEKEDIDNKKADEELEEEHNDEKNIDDENDDDDDDNEEGEEGNEVKKEKEVTKETTGEEVKKEAGSMKTFIDKLMILHTTTKHPKSKKAIDLSFLLPDVGKVGSILKEKVSDEEEQVRRLISQLQG